MPRNTYLLTAATVAGVALGSVSTAALTARAGIPVQKREEVAVTVSRATFAGITQLQAANSVCDIAETQLGLEEGACAISDVEGWCVRLLDGDGGVLDPVEVRAVVRREMTLVDGSPE